VPPERYGGTELILHELAEGLVNAGHDVVLFATGDSATAAELSWLYRSAVWPPTPLVDLNHVSWALAEVVRRGPFDVVHAHSAPALAFARLAPELPLVYTIHHARDEELSTYYRSFPDVRYVAISHHQRDLEEPLPRVRVIHHGLDERRYHCLERSAKTSYVCFVGRLACVKGPHTAIDVAERAGLPITVAGEVHPPDEAWAADNLRARLGKAHVNFVGPIGLPAKVPLLCGARALLAPIEWDEPFGLILIEAMLSGCPVIAFERGSVPELVEPGITGFVARNADHMAEIIRPGGRLEDFDRRRCRERAVRRFSRARMIADHEALYARVRQAAAA
jgi:glycosyltransferase involved in cell wall biosynthesis